MKIRKSDAKGRITGVDSDRAYVVAAQPDGTITLSPIQQSNLDDKIKMPLNEDATKYLGQFGLDVMMISATDHSEQGYNSFLRTKGGEYVMNAEGRHLVFMPWPVGFNYTAFIALARGEANLDPTWGPND
jgi:hypothetical protein